MADALESAACPRSIPAPDRRRGFVSGRSIARSMLRCLRQEVKHNSENDVYGEQLNAFEPIRFAIASNLAGNDHREADGHHFGRTEHQVHGMWTDEVAGKHEHGGNEERNLDAATDGHREA